MTTYRDAGVDIDAGEETVRRIKPLVRRTFTPGVLTDIGAFGSFFELDLEKYRRPVLVSSVDGVGTKLKVAIMTGRHDTVGQDLVNHCVNDIAVCGAEPLYFLDYYATGKLNPDDAEAVVSGFARACEENGCALVGGETAEMPGLYAENDYDLAGTIVGVVEKDAIIDGSKVNKGDVLLGLPSTGLHTNGYSLARHVLLERFDVNDAPPELNGSTLADVLLAVHRSYLRPTRALIDLGLAHGFSHVTGGETAEMPGLYAENDYDLAGTIVGVVEKDAIIDGSKVNKGDVLLGLPSTGLHTNGYSLARHVLLERFDVNDAPPELNGSTLADVLLAVHRSYLRPIRALIDLGLAHGFSHVTGGGIAGNTERVVPDGLSIQVDYNAWVRPPIFDLIQSTGNVPEGDMRRAFNLGVGLVSIVPEEKVDEAMRALATIGEHPFVIGSVQ